MAFTSKNLQSHKSGMTFLKGATFFFLGMSLVMFMTKAFEVTPSMKNTQQFIENVFFTENGSQSNDKNVEIYGASGNARFAGTVTGTEFCLSGDSCITQWPTGGTTTIVGGESIWSTGASNVAYYDQGNVGVKTNTPTEDFQVSSYAKIGSNNFNTGGNFLRIHSTHIPGSFGGPGIPATPEYTRNPNIQLNRKTGIRGDNKNRKIENNGTLKFDYATGSYDYDTKLSLSSTGLMTLDGTGQFDGVCLGSVCKNTWPEAGGESVWMTGTSKIYYTGGNVGIGTDEPTEKFQVSSYAQIGNDFSCGSDTNTSGGVFLRLIGQSSQLSCLGDDVAKYTPNIQLNYNDHNWQIDNDNFLRFKYATGNYDYTDKMSLNAAGLLTLDGNIRLKTGGYIQARSTNGNQLYLDNNGRVGIGTNDLTANNKLHVSTNVSEIMKITNTAASKSRGFAISGLGRFSIYEVDGVDNPERLSIASGGNVGIGTNTPSSRLHVTNDGGFPEVLTLERSGVAQTRKFGIDNNTSRFMLIQNLIGEKFTILSGGNVGIGKLNPTQKLHVDGAVKIGVSLDYTSVTGLYAYDTTSWGTGGLIQCPCDNFETSDECSNPQLLLYSTYGSGCYDRIDTMYANADYKLYRFMGYVCTDPGTIIYTNRYFYGCKEWDINPSYKYRAQLN